ncbi:MAG TPA: hypothetical protein VFE62_09295, partial [Gemmataceae bacterium]|nr:hypothetical protein [Gemmataceae bacterium]
MSALAETSRDRLLARIRQNPECDPFKDLVTGSEESPDEILGFNPDIYSAELAKLIAVCDRFRQASAPKSGIVVVRGDRGSGKTTLLHRLRQHRPGDLILRPTHYRADRSFPQFLLQEIVSELDRRAQKHEESPLDLVAIRLAAEVVFQKLASFTDPEWLNEYSQWHSGRDWFRRHLQDWRTHWGIWTAHEVAIRKELLQTIRPNEGTWGLPALAESQASVLTSIMKLAENHIRDSESRVDLQGVIRAGLYKRLVRFAFARFSDRRKDAKQKLFDYLFDGYLKEYRGVSAPDLAIDTMLRSLLSLLLGQNMATIVTFDAIETPRMLGDPPDLPRSQNFFGGIADFRDNFPGVGFILFVEGGYWSFNRSARSDYAEHRINEGVTDVSGYGTVATIDLEKIAPAMIREMVKTRLAPIQEMLKSADELDSAIDTFFPLTDEMVIRQFPPQLRSLRQGLLGLRADFLACLQPPSVSPGPSPPPPPDPPPVTDALFEERWAAILKTVSESTETNMSGIAVSLLSILTDWLRMAKPSVGDWELQDVEMKSYGPTTYEQFVLVRWTKGTVHQVAAIGLLLGFRTGLSNDV